MSPVTLRYAKGEVNRLNTTPVDPDPDPDPSGENPWPEYDPFMADATTSAQATVNAVTNGGGTATNPKVVVLPAGVHREYVQIPALKYVTFKGHPNGTEIRASVPFTTFNVPPTGVFAGKWVSTQTIAPQGGDNPTDLHVDDRWQYEEMSKCTVLPEPGDTVVTVQSTAGMTPGYPVAIGFGYDACNPYYDHTFVDAVLSGTQIRITDPIVSKYPDDYPVIGVRNTDPFVANPSNAKCVPYVNDGDARHPEAVWLDGELLTRRWLGAPTATQWAMTGSRQVVLGTNPAGRLVEVRRRNHCIKQATACEHVYLDGFTCYHAANDGVILSSTSNPKALNLNVGYAHTKGIVQGGAGARTMHGCRVHHCGQLGATGANSSPDIRNCEVDNNSFSSFRTGWEAGGIKLASCPTVYTYNNHIHHNLGNGLWDDIFANNGDAQRVVHDSDWIHHNTQHGLRPEATAHVTMRNCRIHHNGFGTRYTGAEGYNINAAGGYNYVVENCWIAFGGQGGVQILTQDRAERDYLRDCLVKNNLIVQEDKSSSAMAIAWGDATGAAKTRTSTEYDPYDPRSNNKGTGNRYAFLTQAGAIFAEGSGTRPRYKWSAQHRTIANWRANGNEPAAGQTGSPVLLLDAAAVAAELTANGINPDPRYGLGSF